MDLGDQDMMDNGDQDKFIFGLLHHAVKGVGHVLGQTVIVMLQLNQLFDIRLMRRPFYINDTSINVW